MSSSVAADTDHFSFHSSHQTRVTRRDLVRPVPVPMPVQCNKPIAGCRPLTRPNWELEVLQIRTRFPAHTRPGTPSSPCNNSTTGSDSLITPSHTARDRVGGACAYDPLISLLTFPKLAHVYNVRNGCIV